MCGSRWKAELAVLLSEECVVAVVVWWRVLNGIQSSVLQGGR